MNNRRMILHVVGEVLLIEALLMLLPCVTDIIYAEGVLKYFLITIAVLTAFGSFLVFVPIKNKTVYYKDGFIIVALSWIFLSLFGALPFYLSKEIPSYVDALFETVSGFTTTGSSILSDVEKLSHASLLWRSFTHWIGGMGVIVFITALIPVSQGGGSLNLMRAESPGVEVEKLVPKSRQTARILYLIYFFMSLLLLGLLSFSDMPFFDALCITFGTAGTGGFGVLNSSIGSYSTYVQIVITVFMVLFGINFNLYFLILCKRIKDVFKSSELRVYLTIFVLVTLFITLNIYANDFYPTLKESLQQSAFQVASIMSTTGFATTDFDKWPEVSRVVLLLVMCVGSCAGSTAGGLKVSRAIITVKSVAMEIRRVLNPRRVSVVRYDGKKIKEDVVKTTNAYFIIYIFTIILSVLIVSFDNMDFTSNFSGVIATVNNIGPGFNKVGATGNFSAYSNTSKLVFIFDMLLGRLEIFPILILATSVFHIRRKKK